MLKREKWSGPNPDAVFHRKFEDTLEQIEKKPEPARKRSFLKTGAAIGGTVAACGALFLGVCAANPVWALNLLVVGSIFKSQEEKLQFKGDYESYVKPAGEAGESLTASSSGITMTLSETYCSPKALYISYVMESETPFEETREESSGPVLILEGQAEYSFYSEPDDVFVYSTGDYVDNYTYEGVIRLDLPGSGAAAGEDIQVDLKISYVVGDLKNPDTFDTGYTQEELEAMSDEQWEKVMEEIETAAREEGWDTWPNTHEQWFVEGNWEFQIKASPDDSKIQTAEINETNEQGIGLESVTVTPFEISVKELYTGEADPADYYTALLDADGKMIRMAEMGGSSEALPIYGHDISTVTVYICDYVEYMDELKGKADQPGFKDLMEERALYKKEVHFENQD